MTQAQATIIANKIFTMSQSKRDYILSDIEILSGKGNTNVLFDDVDTDDDMLAIAEAEAEIKLGKFITRSTLQKTIDSYL